VLTIASTGKDAATGRLITHQYRVEGPMKREPNGNVFYRGTAASGMFRVQLTGDELSYSWERSMSTPSMRFAFGSVGVPVTIKETGELIIRSVVTRER
jgi:hypothetical protein